jgi:hypothetical protein
MSKFTEQALWNFHQLPPIATAFPAHGLFDAGGAYYLTELFTAAPYLYAWSLLSTT